MVRNAALSQQRISVVEFVVGGQESVNKPMRFLAFAAGTGNSQSFWSTGRSLPDRENGQQGKSQVPSNQLARPSFADDVSIQANDGKRCHRASLPEPGQV